MKKIFVLLTAILGIVAQTSAKVYLVVETKPLTNGLIGFYPSDNTYFKVDLCDFTKVYDVFDASDKKVGTVTVDKNNLKGYGPNIMQGYFTWTIDEPGDYYIDIPEDAFTFVDWEGATQTNEAMKAPVTVTENCLLNVKVNTSIEQKDVQYVSQLNGIVLTFEGASTIELGTYAIVEFVNDDPYDEMNCGTCGIWSVNTGTADINGNTIVLHDIEDYFSDEYPVKEITGCVTGINKTLLDYGYHGFIIDGIDVTGDINFKLTGETTSLGQPIYKAVIGESYDLQGRKADDNTKGIIINNGKKVIRK